MDDRRCPTTQSTKVAAATTTATPTATTTSTARPILIRRFIPIRGSDLIRRSGRPSAVENRGRPTSRGVNGRFRKSRRESEFRVRLAHDAAANAEAAASFSAGTSTTTTTTTTAAASTLVLSTATFSPI